MTAAERAARLKQLYEQVRGLNDEIAKSVERATYLFERVAHAPPVMSQRLIKLLDERLREGLLADAGRPPREQIRGRIAAVLEAES